MLALDVKTIFWDFDGFRVPVIDGCLIIPEGITTLKQYALNDCIWVKGIILPSTLTTIGSRAFCNCSELQSITIPNSVTFIGNNAFRGCLSLTSITIPDSVTIIGSHAFWGCTSLSNITIPNLVCTIGNFTFAYCKSLKSITISASVTVIGCLAFQGCSLLTSINIPDSVTIIRMEAFRGCTALAQITIPDTVTSIGSGAFDGCNSLSSVLVKPVSVFNGGAVAKNLWNKVFEVQIEDFDDDDSHYVSHYEPEHGEMLFRYVTKISAPDAIVNQLTGPFSEYSTLSSIPRSMRVVPNADTWWGVELWLHWSDPEMDAAEKRVLPKFRQQMVWTVMHCAERLDIMHPEMWLLIFTFVKHE